MTTVEYMVIRKPGSADPMRRCATYDESVADWGQSILDEMDDVDFVVRVIRDRHGNADVVGIDHLAAAAQEWADEHREPERDPYPGCLLVGRRAA